MRTFNSTDYRTDCAFFTGDFLTDPLLGADVLVFESGSP
jgi:hypothetical protein